MYPFSDHPIPACLGAKIHFLLLCAGMSLLASAQPARQSTVSYRGISSLACFYGGCFAVIRDAHGVDGILEWDRSRPGYVSVSRLCAPIGHLDPALAAVGGPYLLFPKLLLSDDGMVGILAVGIYDMPESHYYLINLLTKSCKEILKGTGLTGITFRKGTHVFIGAAFTADDHTLQPSAVEFDCDKGQLRTLFSVKVPLEESSNSKWGPLYDCRPNRFVEASDGGQRFGIFEYFACMGGYENTFSFVALSDQNAKYATLGLKGIGKLHTSDPRFFLPDASMVATDDVILKLSGDTVRERLWSVPSATTIVDVGGGYRCKGWNGRGTLVAYEGTVGARKIRLDLRSNTILSEQPADVDRLESPTAVKIVSGIGKTVAVYTPTHQRVVVFLHWADNNTVAFYDPSRKRFCLMDTATQTLTEIPVDVRYH
jgi:hypothetical protein